MNNFIINQMNTVKIADHPYRKEIGEWIKDNIRPDFNARVSAYAMKHKIENDLRQKINTSETKCFYLTEDALVDAMLLAGFKTSEREGKTYLCVREVKKPNYNHNPFIVWLKKIKLELEKNYASKSDGRVLFISDVLKDFDFPTFADGSIIGEYISARADHEIWQIYSFLWNAFEISEERAFWVDDNDESKTIIIAEEMRELFSNEALSLCVKSCADVVRWISGATRYANMTETEKNAIEKYWKDLGCLEISKDEQNEDKQNVLEILRLNEAQINKKNLISSNELFEKFLTDIRRCDAPYPKSLFTSEAELNYVRKYFSFYLMLCGFVPRITDNNLSDWMFSVPEMVDKALHNSIYYMR